MFLLIAIFINLFQSQMLQIIPMSDSFMSNWPNDFTNCSNITECFNKSMDLRTRYPYVKYYLSNGFSEYKYKYNYEIWCDISKNNWSALENTEEMVIFWMIKHGIILKLQKCNGFAQCLKMGARNMANHNSVYLTFGITGIGYYDSLVKNFKSPYWAFYVSSDEKNDMLRNIEYGENNIKCYD